MSAKLLTILQVERRGEDSFEFDVSKLTTPTWKINASVCRLLFLTVDCTCMWRQMAQAYSLCLLKVNFSRVSRGPICSSCTRAHSPVWPPLLYLLTYLTPSVLWRCWLGGRKGIRPVKDWVVGCWHGYLSGARCRLAHSPENATATQSLASVKSRLVLPFWYWLTRVVLDEGPLNRCVRVCVTYLLTYLLRQQKERVRKLSFECWRLYDSTKTVKKVTEAPGEAVLESKRFWTVQLVTASSKVGGDESYGSHMTVVPKLVWAHRESRSCTGKDTFKRRCAGPLSSVGTLVAPLPNYSTFANCFAGCGSSFPFTSVS